MAAFKKGGRGTTRQRRPICPEAIRYEELKAALRGKGLSPAEYEQAVRRAARKAGI